MSNLNSIASKSKKVVALNNQTKEENAMEKYEVVTITEEDLINKKETRDKYIDRLDILEKVKALFLIPEVNLMSTGMVAKFFDVPVATIRTVYNRHTEELIEEGAKTLKANEIFDSFTVKPSNFQRVQGGVIATCTDGQKFHLTNRDAVYYSPRAVMCLAMMMEESPVANAVRHQILETVCKPEVKQMIVEEADEDIKRIKDWVYQNVVLGDDLTIRMLSAQGLSKRILELKDENKQLKSEKQEAMDTIDVLLNGAMEWGNSPTVNALIRKTAKVYQDRYLEIWQFKLAIAKMWSELFRRLQYGEGIALRKRNADNPLKAVKENEWPAVIRQAAALAEEYDVDIVKVIGELNAKKVS